MSERICSVEGCENPSNARGWCKKHHKRWLKYGDPLTLRRREKNPEWCEIPGCENRSKARGMCPMHIQREMRGADMIAPKQRVRDKACAVEGCQRQHNRNGYCGMHAARVERYGDPGPVDTIMNREPGIVTGRYKDGDGYIQLTVTGRKDGKRGPVAGSIAEHRFVMEQHLGRRLMPREQVHHINGVRDDNRLENLELWVRPQPTGQRVDDLVAWVVEMYPDYVRAAME